MVAPLDKVKALLAALPKEDQAELKRYLADILVTEDEAESIHLATLQATEAGRTVTYTFRQERVRCGKEGCWCGEAAASGGHGPYTYKYWREEGGRLRKQYVGKRAPEQQPLGAHAPRRSRRGSPRAWKQRAEQ